MYYSKILFTATCRLISEMINGGADIKYTCGNVRIYFVLALVVALLPCMLTNDMSIEIFMKAMLVYTLLEVFRWDVQALHIPNRMIVSGIMLWTIGSLGWLSVSAERGTLAILVVRLFTGIFNAVVATAIGCIIRHSLGGGDIKLYFMVGLYLSPLQDLYMIVMSCIIGLLTAVLYREKKFPLAPAISIATVIVLFM